MFDANFILPSSKAENTAMIQLRYGYEVLRFVITTTTRVSSDRMLAMNFLQFLG